MACSPFSLNNYVKREGRARQTEHPILCHVSPRVSRSRCRLSYVLGAEFVKVARPLPITLSIDVCEPMSMKCDPYSVDSRWRWRGPIMLRQAEASSSPPFSLLGASIFPTAD